MGTNYIAPIWRMPRNANNVDNKLSNYSLYFDGSTHEINCGDSAEVDITGPISISVWFNANLVDNARGIVCKNNAAAQQTFAQYFFDLLSGEIRWRAGAATVTHPINADQWYHAVGVYDGSNTTLYIDGTQVATAAASASSYQSNQPMYIGRRLNQSYFQGEITQVCIFDYALTDGTGGTTDQIGYLYNLNNPMVPGAVNLTAPVAYWPLGDNSNPNVTAGYPNISVAADSVFNFNGSTDFIELNSVQSLTGEFSISIWIKPDGFSFSQVILGNDASDWIRLNSANEITFRINGGSGSSDENFNAIAGKNLVSNVWQNLFFYRDSSNNIRVYKNGSLFSNDINTNSDTFSIGKIGSRTGVYYTGDISNVVIWKSDQSSEISNIYNSGMPAKSYTNTPTVWYKLNQSANWEADTAGEWQIPDAVSSYPQSFDFGKGNQSEHIELQQLPSFTSIAVSAWIKTQKTTTRQTIISNNQPNAVAAEKGWDLRLGGVWTGGYEQAEFQFFNSDGSASISVQQTLSKSLADNKWHHVVAIWDGTTDTNAAKIFVDGLLGGQGTSSFAGPISQPPATFEPRIGERGFSSSGAGGGWNFGGSSEDGFISNVQVWNTSLTYGTVSSNGDVAGGQVAQLYNNGVPLTTAIASDNLKAWYKLDNTAVYNNNANYWIIPQGNITPTYTEGVFFGGSYIGGSPSVNYSGMRLTNQSISTSHITYSFWYKRVLPNSGSSTGIVITNHLYLGQVNVHSNGKVQWYGDSATEYINFDANLADGSWHHVLVYYPNSSSFSSDSVRAFIDGNEATKSHPPTAFTATTGPVTDILGTLSQSLPLQVELSNWAVFTTDQTSNIDTIYNGGTPGDISSLNPFAWLKYDSATTTFEGATGANYGLATDSSGNSNNGNLAGKTDGTTTKLVTSNVQSDSGVSSGMTEQNLANNNVSVFNGESNGMNTTNLVKSNLTRKQPYSNYSINFDSADATYMQVPDPGSSVLAYGENKFSFSGWINPTTFVDQGGLIARYKGANNRTTLKGTYASGFDGLMFQSIDIPTTANFHIRWENILTTNEWQHVCLIYDGAGPSCTLYINGVDQGAGVLTGSIPSSLPNFDGYPIDIGVDAMNGLNNRNYDGKFSNFAIFNSILSIDDVLNLYNNGVSQDLNNFRITPIAWWPMDQSYTYFNGTVLVARDVISGNDATGVNLIQEDILGNAPGSEANGTASNIAIADLEGNMKDSDKNAYSINMADYADGVTNPANSGRSTSVP